MPPFITGAAAQTAASVWRHGTSHFGELKYPAGFKSFDYVDPNAPKGGLLRQIALGTYDNFNPAVVAVKGTLAQGIDLIYDTLMVPALDEVTSVYGLIAEAVSYPSDFSSASYRLRQEAKWHDGMPITTDDVIFSFDTLKKLSPQAAASYRHVVKAEKTGDREVTFTFDAPGSRDLPQLIGQLSILPRHWWEGAAKDGKKRDIGESTLEPPLGSGAYRIKEFSAGRNIVFERVPDYWGASLNVNIGRDNFDELRFEYFRDATVAIEALKVDQADWRVENGAKNWATAYVCPAVSEKRIILEEFPINNVGVMQAFAFNIRREKFQDPRVRLAFNYAFDFEELNKQIFFGQYQRIASYFQGTELAAIGLPTGKELEILQTVRHQVPPEVFTTPYSNPVGGNSEAVRTNLLEATRLFKEAGYEVRNGKLVNSKTGEPYAIELLGNNPLFENVFLFFKPSLERLGITVSVRTVDAPQYENLLRTWDFDIVTYLWPETLSPGNELRDYWAASAAEQPGSDNVIGIKNPAVDALITKVVLAANRVDLIAAARALDRVLLWNHYVVPQWSYSKLRVAHWDRFSHRSPLPKYGISAFSASAFPALWWWDAKKAAKASRA
ncbi:MAG TPA: extracellular solute-binding protein [Xanthobacteraceae bacterium]|jgi:microcin C transport system substrate-binding protein